MVDWDREKKIVHLLADVEKSAAPAWNRYRVQAGSGLTLSRLTTGYEREVLDFLARRPSHTFGLTGFIRDNTLVSPRNRGRFYACRDRSGILKGVALIGHAVLYETTSDEAIEMFARLARSNSDAFLSLAEADKSDIFCRHYSEGGFEPQVICRKLLFEQRQADSESEPVGNLRKATLDDLEVVVKAHAEVTGDERGVDPLETDASGFRDRCTYRIERGRTWVWTDRRRLMFKADIISATPYAYYLEGIWVNESERSKGYGLRCMSQLGRTLLQQTRAICVLADQKNEAAQRLYEKAGYQRISLYDTVYL